MEHFDRNWWQPANLLKLKFISEVIGVKKKVIQTFRRGAVGGGAIKLQF